MKKYGWFMLATMFMMCVTGCGGNQGDEGNGGAAGGGGGHATSTERGGDAKPTKTLRIAWAQWEPANYLQTLCEDYTKATGVEVKVEQIPWPQFQDEITKVWSGKSDAYDMIVGDSQWLGKGATEEHYVDLTQWMNKTKPNFTEQALAAYGEYPAGSKKYYAVPCESDAVGFAYRKDLFEDPKEKEAFKKKYNRELAPPKTWSELRDIAEFFTRKPQLYGVALFYSKDYDGATMGYEQMLWSFGGDWHDDKFKVEGVINSPDAVKALEFHLDLKKFNPPGAEGFYFDDTKKAFNNGQVAMAAEWFAFMPGINSDENKFRDKTGYFAVPGEKNHVVSLGGQGISISAYSKNQEESKNFLAWFAKDDTQMTWAKLGGLTCNKTVLASEEFKKAAPYNEVFSETMPLVRDFYNVPEYNELLNKSQTHLSAAASGLMSPKDALDKIAKEHTEILKKAGHLK
jgi:multiple sugar transport system substrate-binding protein